MAKTQKQSDAEYYERNKEKVKARVREYRLKNKEKMAAYQKEWYQQRKRGCYKVKITRQWAMPNKWTFLIKPIKNLLMEEIGLDLLEGKKWIDPFAGRHSPAQYTNDLNPEMLTKDHLPAIDYLKKQPSNAFDGALFDPPYSPRQVKECYNGIGLQCFKDDTRQTFWSRCKDELARVIKPNGKVICFGWSSMGLGLSRGFKMTRILLVPHGGNKNDTIVTVEKKR